MTPGRRRRHEPVGRLADSSAGLEVRDVLLDRRAVLPLDWPVARRPHDRRAPLAARGRLGEVGPVRPHRHGGLPVEAGEAMAHVGRVADLALLAVVDDVYAGLELLAGTMSPTARRTRASNAPGFRRAPRVQRLQGGRQVLGPRKAAGVCRQDAVGAELHRREPPGAPKVECAPRYAASPPCTSERCSSSPDPSSHCRGPGRPN